MNSIMNSIFISIASYKDPELLDTINDCINKARYPHRITIGVCLQDTTEKMIEVNKNIKNIVSQYNRTHKLKLNNIKVYDLHYKKANGAGLARSLIQTELYNNEDYFAQIDSHTKFNNIWDLLAIDQYRLALELNGKILKSASINSNSVDYKIRHVNRVILSTYPNNTEDNNYMRGQFCSIPVPISFLNNNIRPEGRQVSKSRYPTRGYWVCGGFIFTGREWANKVKIEKNIPFGGEEDAMTIKSFLKGWNVYAPSFSICYHNYNNNLLESKTKTRTLVWEDVTLDTSKVDNILDGLYNITRPTGEYVRTSPEYEKYMKIDYKNRKIHITPVQYIELREGERRKHLPPNQ